MDEMFLNGRVVLHPGDCLHVLARLEECSIDSCVTDPPYHLTSIVQRFGADNATPAQFGSDGRYARASAGFMGKVWDGGDVAFRPETWRAVFRVLKPGAHLIAMGGTRTYHRMACAIEDAGFEIRDTISWLYGSGFPKSHDVSKGIDRRGGNAHLARQIGEAIKAARVSRGMSATECDELFCGGTTNWSWFEGRPTGQRAPTAKTFATICVAWPELSPFAAAVAEIEREITGVRISQGGMTSGGNEFGQAISAMGREIDITAPATDAARQWQGWGTALKPACELIVLARKPLSEGTVAANVLRWGTGAINVDGCRVDGGQERETSNGGMAGKSSPIYGTFGRKRENLMTTQGRWPANLIHDGSDEVVAAFPDAPGQSGIVTGNEPSSSTRNTFALYNERAAAMPRGDSGSAARFFYTAKADSDDRLGSKHPTVKPLDLMQWLVRLVTPKGGTVLDPFAGTGTTGEAAWREGMRAVLIEAEPEYQADIRRRMDLVLAGPDERSRESIKAKNLPVDYGPLFGLAAE